MDPRRHKRRPIIINTMYCRHEVSAATFLCRRCQRDRISGSIVIGAPSLFLPQANIGQLYFVLIVINLDLDKYAYLKECEKS